MSRELRRGRTVLWGISLAFVLYLVAWSLPDDIYALLGGPLAGFLCYWLFVRFYERRACRELGGGLRSLLWFDVGAQAGIAAALTPVLVWWLAGLYMPGNIASWHMFSLTLVAFFCIGTSAVLQEVAFRGLLLRCLEMKLGSWWALLASSVLFALAHLANSGESLASLGDFAIIGLALGAALLLSGRLWMPIALHGLYNLTIGAVFGDTNIMPLLTGTFVGGRYWTYQAGKWIIIFAVDGVLAAILMAIAWRRGAFVSANVAWQRELAPSGKALRRAEAAIAAAEQLGEGTP